MESTYQPHATPEDDASGVRDGRRREELTPLARRFATEYMIDLNGAQAYRRSSPGVGYDTAVSNASRLLANAKVQEEIARQMQERAVRLQIAADEVLARLWSLACADVRELVEVYVLPCKHCWATRSREHPAHGTPRRDRKEKGSARAPQAPDPRCKACFGQGEPKVVFKDTRHLSRSGALLLAGIRKTGSGVEYEFHDRFKALVLVGEHLGLWRRR